MQVSIIGHGRSPENRGWGKRIDETTVVRMWDWYPWQSEADYGRRYDYGFFEIHPAMMGTFYKNKKADPSQGWVGSILHQLERCTLPPNTEPYDQTDWNKVGMAMGGIGQTKRLQFTRGTIAALWAIEKWPGAMIVLVGFDNIKAGKSLPIEKAFCDAYRKNPGTFTFANYKGGQTKHGNHDFTVELPLMKLAARRHGCRVVTAQQIFQ